MNYCVEISPAADFEIADSIQWYEKQEIGLGRQFEVILESAIESIRQDPIRFPKVDGEIRRAIVRRFPFIILFTGTNSTISVFAVFHTSRNPTIWRGRID
ncbi:MAG: type II toxin-antitoxin system RelE/ParE family toxin [Chloracidobacterium sp.]|nr:type II toxin-antitoxin system RelE/ParE family toxin [Chloracidobacterium sp.]